MCVYVCGDSNQIPSLLSTAPYMILPTIHHHFILTSCPQSWCKCPNSSNGTVEQTKKVSTSTTNEEPGYGKEKKVSVTMIFCSGWLCARYAAMKCILHAYHHSHMHISLLGTTFSLYLFQLEQEPSAVTSGFQQQVLFFIFLTHILALYRTCPLSKLEDYAVYTLMSS